jgi:hypothetical protein
MTQRLTPRPQAIEPRSAPQPQVPIDLTRLSPQPQPQPHGPAPSALAHTVTKPCASEVAPADAPPQPVEGAPHATAGQEQPLQLKLTGDVGAPAGSGNAGGAVQKEESGKEDGRGSNGLEKASSGANAASEGTKACDGQSVD